eukprot:jgi/Orpsp1_1/1182136/evm.model.c7180000080046.1
MKNKLVLKGLKLLTLGLLGNIVLNVKADDCTIFQNAMQIISKEQFSNMDDCCTSNMLTCENIGGVNHITSIILEGISCPFENREALDEILTSFGSLQHLTS